MNQSIPINQLLGDQYQAYQIKQLDFFTVHGQHYLLYIDYFSKYPEAIAMKNTYSNVIGLFDQMFARGLVSLKNLTRTMVHHLILTH